MFPFRLCGARSFCLSRQSNDPGVAAGVGTKSYSGIGHTNETYFSYAITTPLVSSARHGSPHCALRGPKRSKNFRSIIYRSAHYWDGLRVPELYKTSSSGKPGMAIPGRTHYFSLHTKGPFWVSFELQNQPGTFVVLLDWRRFFSFRSLLGSL